MAITKEGTKMEVNTTVYERAHGKKPRGYGLWYFYFDKTGLANYRPLLGSPQWYAKGNGYKTITVGA